MSELKDCLAIFGHTTVTPEGPEWRGLVVDESGIHEVAEGSLLSLLRQKQRLAPPSAIAISSSSELGRLIARSTPDLLPQVVDLRLAIRTGHTTGHLRDSPRDLQKIESILGRFLQKAARGSLSYDQCIGLLGARSLHPPEPARVGRRDQRSPTSRTIDRLLKLLFSSLRRSGELDRFRGTEMPLRTLLWAQENYKIHFSKTELSKWAVPEGVRPALIARSIRELGFDIFDLRSSAALRVEHLGALVGQQRAEEAVGMELDNLVREECRLSTHGQRMSQLLEDASNHECIADIRAALGRAGKRSMPARYDTLGTVTGRITMRSPPLQWLRREARVVVVPGPGRRLLYPDYNCFEPTILAAASGDAALLDACLNDLYTLAASVLGLSGENARDTAKSLLLADLYGRNRTRSADELSEITGCTPREGRAAFRELWEGTFHVAHRFRVNLREATKTQQKGSTANGNWRRLAGTDQRLDLNHFLQGTGALIAKTALIEILRVNDSVHLIAPMHDGFVLSVPTKETGMDMRGERFVKCMTDAFSRYFDGIEPRVTCHEGFI